MKWSSLAVLLVVFASPLSARADLFSRLASRQAGELPLNAPESVLNEAPAETMYANHAGAMSHHPQQGHSWGYSTVGGTCCEPESHYARWLWSGYCCSKNRWGNLLASFRQAKCCEPACHAPACHEPACHAPVLPRVHCCKPKFAWLKPRCCTPPACTTCAAPAPCDSCCDPCGCKRRPLLPNLLAWIKGKHCCDQCGGCADNCNRDSCAAAGGEVWSEAPLGETYEGETYETPILPTPAESDESPSDVAPEQARRGLVPGNFRLMSLMLGR